MGDEQMISKNMFIELNERRIITVFICIYYAY